MNCDQFPDHYDLYALGVADPPQGEEIPAHLNRGCEGRTLEVPPGKGEPAAAPGPAGKPCEMWVLPKGAGAKPAPAGLFQSQSDGTAMHIQRGPVDPNTGIVAVTMEDEAGSDRPTTPILILAGLE